MGEPSKQINITSVGRVRVSEDHHWVMVSTNKGPILLSPDEAREHAEIMIHFADIIRPRTPNR